MKKILTNIMCILGLFVPYPQENVETGETKWVYTILVGGIPLGWIIIIVAWLF